tara:strand:+ start:223 stop:705 length:483 start_codon:yes stop_codon:yes gene_type:complete
MIRVGIGYDIHQLKKGEMLIVGGVNIPSECGSVGHSDGDVLSHAIADALLGAAGLGDIGKIFPSEDNTWKDAKSTIFLEDVLSRIKKLRFNINNIDATIILQEPKLGNYIDEIKLSLATTMDLDHSSISIKATTTDRMGAIGEGLGWGAMAIASIIKEPL